MPARNNLLVVRTGRHSLHRDWVHEDLGRNWNLCVLPYEYEGIDATADLLTDLIICPGNKWNGIDAWLPEEWREHQYICFPDDDLRVPPGGWSRFFEHVSQISPNLCAPALTRDSIASHPVTLADYGYVYRQTTFVEIMMPCFRFDALDRLRDTFSLTRTGIGWGLDYLWAKMLEYQKIFIVDDAPVAHWRESTTSHTVEAHREMLALFDQYGLHERPERAFGGKLRT